MVVVVVLADVVEVVEAGVVMVDVDEIDVDSETSVEVVAASPEQAASSRTATHRRIVPP
jgi:hypothetical protein